MDGLRATALGVSIGVAALAFALKPVEAQPGQQANAAQSAPVQAAAAPVVEDAIDPNLAGPAISHPEVMALLDRSDEEGDCRRSGRLVFGCLLQALAASETREKPIGARANAFNLKVASEIRSTIEADLLGYRKTDGIDAKQQLQPGFLTHPKSRIELVGIVNRMDRQFVTDPVPGVGRRERCGEISLIYRFSYSLTFGKQSAASRLPVTMNLVFPAIPRARTGEASSCAHIAQRWQREMERPAGRTPEQVVADLTHAEHGVVAPLDGRDVERVELNMQAYRISAGADATDLGSTAEYVIRVFRWSPDHNRFVASYLNNQIDRARLLGNPRGDANSCDPGVSRPMSRAAFLAYLTRPAVLSEVDNGTLNIPLEFLACRATSVSPGGAHRSGNAPFWSGPGAAEQIFTDAEIERAMRAAEAPDRQFSFMRNAGDFRLRLNELSCTGCHQARAIAGFHFPGADREGTPVSNAVFLPGSPHFYGDQVRRRDILRRLAAGEDLTRDDLAQSYGSRPLNRFRRELASTQLLGGWGGACLTEAAMQGSRRQWQCQTGLQCRPIFDSPNAPGLGTCTPAGRQEIGDPMQFGRVITAGFRRDRYLRVTPAPVGNWSVREGRNTLIPASLYPRNPPPQNSYYAAHQEYYEGNISSPDAATRRDAQTGGFPGGMLRLSECTGLPGEATCGLTASTGFNACLTQVSAGKASLADCFRRNTSYAGMRTCSSSSPCRDDYICLRPIGYTAANGRERFLERQRNVSYKADDYGQREPDSAWLGRNNGAGDQRGICIPPYFVFQFRSDGHPNP
jgi:hypothetical protein